MASDVRVLQCFPVRQLFEPLLNVEYVPLCLMDVVVLRDMSATLDLDYVQSPTYRLKEEVEEVFIPLLP